MRILMLAQFYPPTIGGEERHVRNLAIELATRGHDVSLATLWHQGLAEYEIDQGVRIYRIRATVQRASMLFSEQSRQYAPPFPDPEALAALQRIVQRERPEIVHAHNWIVHSFVPLKRWSKARLIVTLHDYSLVCVQKRLTYQNAICSGPAISKCIECSSSFYGPVKGIPVLLANRMWGQIERKCVDMFLPVSQIVAEGTQLARYRVPYRVIPNFVPDNVSTLRDESDPRLSQLPRGDFLLFVGDVRHDKGVDVLFEAYKQLGTTIPLILIGRLGHDLIEDFPPNARALEDWPHTAVMEAWHRCTLALAPSIWTDACPTVVMEAMSTGRPVIASRIGGLANIVADGETGLLVTPENAEELCAAMRRLLNNPEERCRMGRAAQQRVVAFQAQTVVSRIEQVYQDVLVGSYA
jgi:glycosyltransferase involved in cell wall biosynthesis